jgi:large subunit ribosomal protein L9
MQNRKQSQNQLLLLDDVYGTGRKGDVVSVKRGYARNFLVPRSLAVVADKRTLRMQEKLRTEREQQAVADRSDSEAIKSRIHQKEYETIVKVDHEGHMYGSVSVTDIIALVQEVDGIALERRMVKLGQPLKKLGAHLILLGLKEGVDCEIAINIKADRPLSNEVTETKAE